MKRITRPLTLAVVLMALACAGCQFFVPPDQAYVQADKATYDAIAPEYLGYLIGDVNRTEEDKERRRTTVETWDRRIQRSLKPASP